MSTDGVTRIYTLDECLSLVHLHAPYSTVTAPVMLSHDTAAQFIALHFSTLLGFLRYVRTPVSLRHSQVHSDARAVLIAKTSALRTQRFLLLQGMKNCHISYILSIILM